MTTANQNISSSHKWEILCQQQGWNDQSKITILEGFLSEVGLMGSFLTYAQEVADDENNTESAFA